jgi:hypothetical protein
MFYFEFKVINFMNNINQKLFRKDFENCLSFAIIMRANITLLQWLYEFLWILVLMLLSLDFFTWEDIPKSGH